MSDFNELINYSLSKLNINNPLDLILAIFSTTLKRQTKLILYLDFSHQIHCLFLESSNTQICEKKDDNCATKARRAMEMKLYDDNIVVGNLNVSET